MVNIKDVEFLEKDVLVDLFHKNVVPQPQRKYRNNRGGRLRTKNQITIDKRKRRFSQISGGKDEQQNKLVSTQSTRMQIMINVFYVNNKLCSQNVTSYSCIKVYTLIKNESLCLKMSNIYRSMES